MPELPEVETVRRGLEKILVGQKVLDVEIREPKSAVGDFTKAERQKIIRISRRSKMLVVDLDNDYSLAVHLRMTGQLIYRDSSAKQTFAGGHPTESFFNELPDKSTRVIFTLENGSLFFNDQRKFGFIKIIPTNEVRDDSYIKALGPEPFREDSLPTILANVKKRPKSAIKSTLLDQKVVAGLGSIYADEALWLARVHPAQKVGKISDKKLSEIIKFSAEVMNESIKLGGTSFSTFRQVDGGKGEYFSKARAYGREGQPCQRCGTTMVKTKVAGRGSTFCPACQRLN